MALKAEVRGTQTRLRDIAAQEPAEAGRKDGMRGGGACLALTLNVRPLGLTEN